MCNIFKYIVFLLGLFVSFVWSEEINTITLDCTPVNSYSLESKLYVICADTSSVLLIDTITNKVKKTIPVGSKPISATLQGDYLYVNNSESTFVSVINTITDKVITKITTGSGPISSVVIGKYLYVNNFDSSIGIINLTNNQLVKKISFTEGVAGPILSSIGNKIYIHHVSNNLISVFDTNKNVIIKNFSTGKGPQKTILVNKLLYTLNSEGTITIVYPDTYKSYYPNNQDNILVGTNPTGFLLVGDSLYVNNSGGDSISIIDVYKNIVEKEIITGEHPSSMILHKNIIYIFNQKDDTISLLDTKTKQIISHVSVGDNPISGTIVGSKLYVNNNNDKSISIINLRSPILHKLEYKVDNKIPGLLKIMAHFDQILAPDSTMKVVLNNKNVITLGPILDTRIMVGEYLAKEGEIISKLIVQSIESAFIRTKNGVSSNHYYLTENLELFTNICKFKAPYFFRVCPQPSFVQNFEEIEDNLVCEKLVDKNSKGESEGMTYFETLIVAVRMLRIDLSSSKTLFDTYVGQDNDIIQTGFDYNLIPSSRKVVKADLGKYINRIDAYNMLMTAVCLAPETADIPGWMRIVHKVAYDNGITVKPWANFGASRPMTKKELYTVVGRLADWADYTGGCRKFMCSAD